MNNVPVASISITGNTVFGSESSGTVQFLGNFSQLSWVNPNYENWYGFNVGAVAAVPEPTELLMLGSGLFVLFGLVKAKRKTA